MKIVLASIRAIFSSIILALFVVSAINAQYSQIILNTPDSGNKEYIANDYIKMLPGYKYTATSGNRMHARIDETFVSPADYSSGLFTDATFNRSINTSLPVGFTPGSHNVSATGAANYTFPINLPAGTNSMQPNLAIVYNSQSGNGILGMGWHLSGLSAITRDNKNIYLDNEAQAVQLQNSDRFSLDGNRLILFNGTYGANAAEYRTESETFSKITSWTTHSYGPEWFKVETKNGITLEYGGTNESRVLAADGNTVIYWRLSSMYDKFGNQVDFHYEVSSDRESRISKIFYTRNTITGLEPYNEVTFIYETRDDDNFTAVAGSVINQTVLLGKIKIKTEGQNYKEYEFKYGKDNIHSYLQEVIEYGSDGSQLNSTRLKYGDSGVAFQSVSSTTFGFGFSGHEYNAGDYNGDGITDIMVASYDISDTGLRRYQVFNIYTKSSNAFFNSPSPNISIAANWLGNSSKNFRLYSGSDFDGDSRDDILWTRINLGVLDKIIITRLNGDATAKIADHEFAAPTYYLWDANVPNPNGPSVIEGDFDGDGLVDYITLSGDNTKPNPHLSFPFKNPSEINYPIFRNASLGEPFRLDFSGYPDQVFVLDFDGNGTEDLMYIIGTTCKVVTFVKKTGGFGIRYETKVLYTSSYPTSSHEIYLGDFNGDNKTDLLTKSSSNVWQIAYSTGISFQTNNFTFVNVPNPVNLSKIRCGDFNGDGLTDIYHTFSSGGFKIELYFSKGDAFYREQYTDSASPLTIIVGDFNGDSKNDIIDVDPQSGSSRLLHFNANGKNYLLHKILNGFNHTTEFRYKLLTEGGSFYVKGTSSIFPVMDIKPAAYMVHQVIVPDGRSSNNITTYSYQEAKLHLQGRGFLGFKKLIASNDVGSTIYDSVSEFELNTTFYANALKKQTTKLFGELNPDLEITYTNNFVDLGSKRFWYRLDGMTEVDKLNNTRTTTTSYTYNANGNITQEVINLSGIETITTAYSMFGTYGSWMENKPTRITITKTRTGSSAFTKTIDRSYNSTTGFMTGETDFFGLAKQVTNTYVSDSYGNIESVTLSASGLTSRITEYEYDLKGRFVTKIINPLAQETATKYDPKWGQPLEITGIDGLTTYNEYDAFGRLKKTTMSEGYSVSTTYNWDVQTGDGTGTTTINNAIYYTHIQHPGKPDIKTWHDLYDRERKTETEGYNSQTIATVTSYTARGQIRTTTTPFYSSGNAIVTTYGYDSRDRIQSTNDGAKTILYSYDSSTGNGNTKVTVTNTGVSPNIVSTKTTDATGKVIATSDATVDMSIEYYSHGNQKKITIEGVDVVTMQYDAYARQTQLVDKNAGTTTYEYNAYGELQSQIDARSNTHQMQYDLLGRITSQTVPEGTGSVTYEYVTSGNGLNQLKKATGYNGITKEFAYDIYSRPTQVTEKIDGTNFSTSFAYNTYGDVTSVTYPSGFAINKNYDSNGYLTNVKNGANTITIYSTGNINAFGQTTNYTLGNGIASTVTYNNYGVINRYQAGTVQDLTLNFSMVTGNLSSRIDAIKGRTESFQYDNINRLTQSQVTGLSAMTVQYTTNGNGNINTKTDVGTYTYDVNRVHAVTQVTNSGSNISTLQQDITFSSFQQPNTITENNYVLTLTYGPEFQRKKTVLTQSGSNVYTRYFIDTGFERNISGGVTQDIHYLACGDGLNAIVVRQSGTDTYYYTYTDHLGSILTVTNASGTVVAEQNFDAWGRQRNPSTWAYSSVPSVPSWLYRGYTGHEQLPQFALINMNGRLYDPLLNRMLSPDNFVVDAYDTQAYNRYTYAFNNPLSYNDPDGENPVLIAMGIGGLIGGGLNLWGNWGKVGSFAEGLNYFGAGFVGGATSVVNPIGGIALTASLNLGIDAINGHLNNLSTGGDWAGYLAGNLLNSSGVGGAGAIGINAARQLGLISWSNFNRYTTLTAKELAILKAEGIAPSTVQTVETVFQGRLQTTTAELVKASNAAGATAAKALISSGDDLAFGLNKGLNQFAQSIGAKTYRQFTNGGFRPNEIRSAIENSTNKLHFDLTNFSKVRYSMFNPSERVTLGNITNWELYTIYNTPGALNRTTFYKLIDGVYKVVNKPF